jgi:hypothetical protein
MGCRVGKGSRKEENDGGIQKILSNCGYDISGLPDLIMALASRAAAHARGIDQE